MHKDLATYLFLPSDYLEQVKSAVDAAMFPFGDTEVELRRESPDTAQLLVENPFVRLVIHLVQERDRPQSTWRLPHFVSTHNAVANVYRRLHEDAVRFMYTSEVGSLNHYERKRRNDSTYCTATFLFNLHDSYMTARFVPNIILPTWIHTHTIDLSHSAKLLEQDNGHYTDWAMRDSGYIFLANVCGVLEANKACTQS